MNLDFVFTLQDQRVKSTADLECDANACLRAVHTDETAASSQPGDSMLWNQEMFLLSCRCKNTNSKFH